MRPEPPSFDGSAGGTAPRSRETADRRLFGVALLLVAVLAMRAGGASGQTHPNLDRGFAPERAYQIGEIDQVSLYNGNLSITLPIGQAYPLDGGLSYQLVLSYNSKLWDFQRYPSTGRPVGRKLPSRAANAGLGWVFGMGQLFGPDQDPNTPDTWTYVSPDGAEHELEASTLHPGIPADGEATYSRDGSYLRLRRAETGLLAARGCQATFAWSHVFDPQSMPAKRTNGASTNYFVYTADEERYWTYHSGGARGCERVREGAR